MQLDLRLPRRRFVVGEPLRATIVLTNDEDETVEVPDPADPRNQEPSYTITGPGHGPYADGFAFSLRSASRGEPQPEVPGPQPGRRRLGPGEHLRVVVRLDTILSLDLPGAYSLAVRMRWRGQTREATPVELFLERLSLDEVAVGIDVGLPGAGEAWLAWSHRAADGSKLIYQALSREATPHLGEWSSPKVGAPAVVSREATGLQCPWTAYDRKTDLLSWVVWREAAAICALPTTAPEPQRIDLGAAPVRVLRPAVQERSGDLNILAVADGGRVLLRVRFPATRVGAPPGEPRILWRLDLPGRVSGGRCAPTSCPDGTWGAVALVLLLEGGMPALGAVVERDEGPVLRVAEVEGALVLPGTEPGIRVESSGEVHVAAPFETTVQPALVDAHQLGEPGEPERRLSIAAAVFGGDKEAAELDVRDVAALPATPEAAALSFPVSPDRRRPEWLVLLPGGRAIRGFGRVVRLSQRPVLPLELVPLSQMTYALAADPEKGPVFITV